jgi:hypothetical protein
VPQGTLGVVVGRRQVRVVDESDDRLPIVQDFAGERANFLLSLVLIALAIPADSSDQAFDDGVLIPLGDLLSTSRQRSRAMSWPKPEPAS